MFRAPLEFLMIKVSHRGWKDGSAFGAAILDDKEDDNPVRHYIEHLRSSRSFSSARIRKFWARHLATAQRSANSSPPRKG